MVRVRFAPSPTGVPHIGNTRTALFNFLFAKSTGGEFILRIEDTDKKRIIKGAEEAIMEILNWLGIEYTGEVLHQSQRLDIYKKYANKLIGKKTAYEKDGAIWVNIPDDKIFEWEDLVGVKKISFKGKDVEDFVILKSDGFPTYHLANVVDDHLTDITHVIRGEEWISSTPKHLYLYESFEWIAPRFAHLPVILGPDKTKLSKRHGAKSALDYKADGYIKETLLNYMSLLGWSGPRLDGGARLLDKRGHEQEVFSLADLINLFKLEDVNTASPIFDILKFKWLNGVWIRNLELPDLKNRLLDFYSKDNGILKILNSDTSDELIKAAASRMRTLMDFKALINKIPSREKTPEEKRIAKKLEDHLLILGERWEDEKLLNAIKEFSKAENVPFKIIFFLLTGKEQGIGILELNQIYGKEFLINNLKS